MSSESISFAAIEMLKRATGNGLNQIAYDAIINAAKNSEFFAGQLNAAAYSGFELSIGGSGKGCPKRRWKRPAAAEN